MGMRGATEEDGGRAEARGLRGYEIRHASAPELEMPAEIKKEHGRDVQFSCCASSGSLHERSEACSSLEDTFAFEFSDRVVGFWKRAPAFSPAKAGRSRGGGPGIGIMREQTEASERPLHQSVGKAPRRQPSRCSGVPDMESL